MKTKILYLGLFIGLFSLMINVISCDKEDVTNTENKAIQQKEVLKEVTLLGNEINLPIGTQWFYTNKEHNEVEFELPKGYKFLLYNKSTGEFRIALDGGGYSCTCSAGGSCTTFYNKDLGYGCLQSNCSGSCTGKNAKLASGFTIEGVLYTDNDMLDSNSKEKASLSEIGKIGIFKIDEFKNEIKRTYDIVYKNLDKPNFSLDNFESKLEKNKYVVAKTYLYGFEIGIVIPNDSNLDNLMPNLQRIALEDAPKSCSCSGGGSGCKLEKEGLFGYVAYYCTGCTTCTMK
jgi:hypothetical protein